MKFREKESLRQSALEALMDALGHVTRLPETGEISQIKQDIRRAIKKADALTWEPENFPPMEKIFGTPKPFDAKGCAK